MDGVGGNEVDLAHCGGVTQGTMHSLIHTDRQIEFNGGEDTFRNSLLPKQIPNSMLTQRFPISTFHEVGHPVSLLRHIFEEQSNIQCTCTHENKVHIILNMSMKVFVPSCMF